MKRRQKREHKINKENMERKKIKHYEKNGIDELHKILDKIISIQYSQLTRSIHVMIFTRLIKFTIFQFTPFMLIG